MKPEPQLTWLTNASGDKIRSIFEPKYGRILSDTEVEAIANYLVSFFELVLKNRGAQYESH